ncbi:hypothetical protein [Haloarchaeobius sp. DFWS5]|uniref:hypothetical protein n=1 Tax=Haloarchaeobius sp. DFWS5 TaxID=3446114 RepID=UPI003EBB14C8
MSRYRLATLLGALAVAVAVVTNTGLASPSTATDAVTQQLAGRNPLFVATVAVWCLAGVFMVAVLRLDPEPHGNDH